MPIDILCPTASGGGRVHKVGPGQTRFMRANGTFGVEGIALVSQSSSAEPILETALAKVAKVRVFNHSITFSSPELAAGPGGATTAVTKGNTWCVNNLPVPALSAGTVTVGIIAWQVDPIDGSVLGTEFLNFLASDSQGEFCDGCPDTSGSGSGSGGMHAVSSQAKGSVALSMAPLVWGLLVSGFEAGKGLLNGPWSLDLKHVVGGFCVWDNGGDGDATPLVELRCESPFATTWKLTLRHGAAEEVYTRPAAEWNPLTPNAVYRAGGDESAAAARQITLIPS